MNGVSFVNCGPSTHLAPASVVRITFNERFGIQVDAGFAVRFHAVYKNLGLGHKYFPISADSAVVGLNAAVEDLKLYTGMTAAELTESLDSLGGIFVRVARVELLDGPDASNATGTQGESERNALASQQEMANATSGFLAKLADGLGASLDTLKWLLIAFVFVFLLIAASKARSAASAIIKQ